MMDDQRFRAMIQRINQEQIPEDTVNLWPNILKQIEAGPKRRTLFPRTRTGWLIAALIALLTVGAAAAAVDRLLRVSDSGLEAVDQQGLVTHLNLTQTDGNISVTLDYAYADSNRISVGYFLDALVKPDDPIATGAGMIYPVDDLHDDQGHSFVGVAGGGGGGGGGGDNEPTPTMTLVSTSHETNYDVFESLGTPNSLNLTLQVEVYSRTDPNSPILDPKLDQKLATFTFTFTIPFYPGLLMTEPKAVSAAGMTLTLQKFVVTPSMTRAVICYDQPPAVSTDQWWPHLTLRAGGKDIVTDAAVWTLTSESVGNTIPANCLVYALPQALSPEKGEWTVAVPDLYTAALSGDAFQNYLTGRLKQYSIEVVPQPSGGFTYNTPADMDHTQLSDIIMRVSREATISINGPWAFTFKMG